MTHPPPIQYFLNSTILNAQNAIVGQNSSDAVFRQLEPKVVLEAIAGVVGLHDQSTCHPGTRREILNLVSKWSATTRCPTPPIPSAPPTADAVLRIASSRPWVQNQAGDASSIVFRDKLVKEPVVWLNGPAGAGKSTIMRTIARELEQQGRLLGSFFCSAAQTRCSDPKLVIPTLLDQVLRRIPCILPKVEEALRGDPYVFSKSLELQTRKCLIEPLNSISPDMPTSCPNIVLIDGLDEIEGVAAQRELAKAFVELPDRLPNFPLRILVASRAEGYLCTDLGSSSSSIALDKQADSELDIIIFLKEELIRIRKEVFGYLHLPEDWPGADFRTTIVKQSSRQFILPSMVIRILGDPHSIFGPKERVEELMRTPNQIDWLYASVFKKVKPTQYIRHVLEIVGLFLMPGGLQDPSFLDVLQGWDKGTTVQRLSHLHSLLLILPHSITPHHRTLPEFIFDPARSEQFGLHVEEQDLRNGLHALYASILKTAIPAHLMTEVLEILAVILLDKGLSDPSFLDVLRDLKRGTTIQQLANLNPLLHIRPSDVCARHSTLSEYILGPTPSTTHGFHVDGTIARRKYISLLMEPFARNTFLSFTQDDWRQFQRLYARFESDWKWMIWSEDRAEVDGLRLFIVKCISARPLSEMAGIAFSHFLPEIVSAIRSPRSQLRGDYSFPIPEEGQDDISAKLCHGIEEEVKRRLQFTYTRYGQEGLRLIFVSKVFSRSPHERRMSQSLQSLCESLQGVGNIQIGTMGHIDGRMVRNVGMVSPRPSGPLDTFVLSLFSEDLLEQDMEEGLAFQWFWPNAMSPGAGEPDIWDSVLDTWFQENFHPSSGNCRNPSFFHEMVHDFTWILKCFVDEAASQKVDPNNEADRKYRNKLSFEHGLGPVRPWWESFFATQISHWIDVAVLHSSSLCVETCSIFSRIWSHQWPSPRMHQAVLERAMPSFRKLWTHLGLPHPLRFDPRTPAASSLRRPPYSANDFNCMCGSSEVVDGDIDEWREEILSQSTLSLDHIHLESHEESAYDDSESFPWTSREVQTSSPPSDYYISQIHDLTSQFAIHDYGESGGSDTTYHRHFPRRSRAKST